MNCEICCDREGQTTGGLSGEQMCAVVFCSWGINKH